MGILASRKGKNGGYMLARPAERIMVGAVIRALDGPLAPFPCASRTGYARCEDCGDEATCPVRLMMAEVRDVIAGILDHRSLADMCRLGYDALEAFDYHL